MSRQTQSRKRRPHRTHTCSGKVRYRDKTEALGALRTIQAASERDVTPCRTYDCHLCRGVHLTSQERRT